MKQKIERMTASYRAVFDMNLQLMWLALITQGVLLVVSISLQVPTLFCMALLLWLNCLFFAMAVMRKRIFLVLFLLAFFYSYWDVRFCYTTFTLAMKYMTLNLKCMHT